MALTDCGMFATKVYITMFTTAHNQQMAQYTINDKEPDYSQVMNNLNNMPCNVIF